MRDKVNKEKQEKLAKREQHCIVGILNMATSTTRVWCSLNLQSGFLLLLSSSTCLSLHRQRGFAWFTVQNHPHFSDSALHAEPRCLQLKSAAFPSRPPSCFFFRLAKVRKPAEGQYEQNSSSSSHLSLSQRRFKRIETHTEADWEPYFQINADMKLIRK